MIQHDMMMWDHGNPVTYNQALDADVDVLVFGHSHIPWDTVAGEDTANPGLRLLNPGSPTDRRRQPECTMMTAVAHDGQLTQVRLVPVDRTP